MSGLSLGWVIFAIGVLLALVLALPGQTVTTKYVNDLFIFLDGAYRIVEGQVPNRDFHSSLGPLAFYLPAIGYAVTGSLGAAMPLGMALAVLLLSAAGAYTISSRMRPIIGIPLAIFLLLVATVPLNPGEGIGDLSFAMFYNRLGWTAVGLLLVMYLPPKENRQNQPLLDALCAASLTIFLLYLKASYGLVALGFIVFTLTGRETWRWSALALGMTAIAMVVIELLWGGSSVYFADIMLAREVSGDLPDVQRLATIALINLADLAVYLVFAVLLLALRRNFRDFLFLGFCAATGILIIEQNFQIVGIITLAAGAAIAAELLAGARQYKGIHLGLPLLLGILVVPVSVQNGMALALHSSLALSQQGDSVAMPGFAGVRLVELTNEGLYRNFSRYNASLADGAAALVSLDTTVERVVVFDFVTPFTAGLGLVPPQDDSPWYHWGRTLDDDIYPPADETLADAKIIMEPKWPIEVWTAGGMRRVYAPYLDANFTLETETADWRIYVRRPASSALLENAMSVTKQSTSAQP
jgi:hypothetical protein